MVFQFQYFGTRSGKCLTLTFEKHVYLFNSFEGIQRYMIETKSKLSKVKTVFLPNLESVPSFLGTYLTLGDCGKNGINIVTEDRRVFDVAKPFAYRKDCSLFFHNKFYEDDNLRAEKIPMYGTHNVFLKFKDVRGNFDVEKATKYGIPKVYYKLLCEKRVVHYNGEKYDGNDFISLPLVFEKFFIIFGSCEWEILPGYLKEYNPDVIIFFDELTYRSACLKLKNIRVFCLKDNDSIEYLSAFEIQKRLNSLCSNFCLPFSSTSKINQELNSDLLRNLDVLKYNKELKRTEVIRSDIPEVYHVEEKKFYEKQVIFLGTGAAIPSKYRNVSAILLKIEDIFICLDAGEDTFQNIHRFYGNYDILKRIEIIYISHPHADHHLGAVKLISEILKERDNLIVICPSSVRKFLEYFIKNNVVYLNNRDLMANDFFTKVKNKNPILCNLNISTCEVDHCQDSFGVRIDHKGLSVSYSGDTAYCLKFAALSKNVDLMIHECTFDNGLAAMAQKTKHSTLNDAINIFNISNAKKLILTHFSQRYAKNVVVDQVICAFDFFTYNFEPVDCYKIQKTSDEFLKMSQA